MRLNRLEAQRGELERGLATACLDRVLDHGLIARLSRELTALEQEFQQLAATKDSRQEPATRPVIRRFALGAI